ncbi:MAG: hypothetical protein M3022_03180, partial [Actinomycetota bacterium]|nr:hypothetical protein [Actinomycetota bacterium]
MRTIASAIGFLAALVAVPLVLGDNVLARSATPVRATAVARTSRPAPALRLTGTIPRALRVVLRRLVARGFVTPIGGQGRVLRGRHTVAPRAFAAPLPQSGTCYAGALNCSARPCVELAGASSGVVLLPARSVINAGPGRPHASAQTSAHS